LYSYSTVPERQASYEWLNFIPVNVIKINVIKVGISQIGVIKIGVDLLSRGERKIARRQAKRKAGLRPPFFFASFRYARRNMGVDRSRRAA
jgi:hypothetical protein